MSDRPTMTTWEDADGPIWDEYSFMTNREWLDETEDPTVAICTDWVAVRQQTIWRSDLNPLCPVCHGDGSDQHGDCARCEGEGSVDTIEQVTADHSWPDQPAASDIEAVADDLGVVLNPHDPFDEVADAVARLRRIAAGIRDRGSRGAPHGNVGDGPFMSVPTPRDPQPEGEDL